MGALWIILLIAETVTFLSANPSIRIDCLEAEQICLQDPQCNSSYHVFKDCSHGETEMETFLSRCQKATSVLQQSDLSNCKCQHRMKKEEHCLNVYWTVHPVQGDINLYNSPYDITDFENMVTSDYLAKIDPSLFTETTNICLQQSDICSDYKKCAKHKTLYVSHCSQITVDGFCDRGKCHRQLRIFFEKVPEDLAKRLLFCPCQDSNCAERRRRTIVPECSFEQNYKKNCLQLHNDCMKDIICRSYLADFQKNCFLFDKTSEACLPEQYGPCLQSYIRMIGTPMTPNYINNSSLDVSLWCTCDGSGNQLGDCTTVDGMFNKNRCLRNAIIAEMERYSPVEPDAIHTVSINPQQPELSVISPYGQATDKNIMVNHNKEEYSSKTHGNTASCISSPSLPLTVMLWFLKLFYSL
ncbi:hypothetical protein GDO86_005536 [Hymenochirus boettgeri]|uniref:GDNF/GAS1 domain-containing protein n=1 Tax=Hymenochirus boettgeri TaxID=247094 RepID=A0A8T2J9P5_9PIPI|nr:hypothetical protein GDO86_005536 [Hymenochirus boettgeri]